MSGLRVTLSALELALYRALKARHAGRGVKFSYAELEQDWRRTGLRHCDLNEILHRLSAEGCLRRVPGQAQAVYQLTPDGVERLFNGLHPIESLPSHDRDDAVLERVRSRKPPAAAGAQRPRRRAGDATLSFGDTVRWLAHSRQA
jgi:hypothetical protein